MKGLLCSFSYALQGIAVCLKTGRNFRLMVCAAGYVVWTGWIARLSPAEWGLELLCCGLVLALEGLNTALERLCDRVTRERDPLIGQAKDCAAGAVLLAAAVSALVWLIVTVGGGHWHAVLAWRGGGVVLLTLPAALWWSLRSR